MGLFRTIYREAREILGMKPPPENNTQRAERICGEVKGDNGGKRTKDGDDFLLSLNFEGRDYGIRFESEAQHWIISAQTSASPGVAFSMNAPPPDEDPGPAAGIKREAVGNGIFLEASSVNALAAHSQLLKDMPVSSKQKAISVLSTVRGTLELEDGVLTLSPGTDTMQGRSVKYTVVNHLRALNEMATALDEG